MNKFYTFRKILHYAMLLSFILVLFPLGVSAQTGVEENTSQNIKKQQLSDEEKAIRKRLQASIQVLDFSVPEDPSRFLNGNDCDLASTVCSSSTISFNPSNAGNNDFSGSNSDGCLSGEHLSAWYYFELRDDTPPNSSLDFVISPNDNGDDYDFAVWGPNVDCETLGAPIRCSFAAPSGDTGLSPGAGDNSEGAGGNRFVNSLVVNPGDGFFLMVDNWSQSNQGFDLNWSNTGAPFLDCNADPPCGMNVVASNDITVCAGSIAQTISGTASGNSGAVNYTWTANPPNAINYLTNPNAASTTVQVPAGQSGSITYTLTASDGSGCDGDDNVIVNITQGPPPSLDPIPDMCNEEAPITLNTVQGGYPGTWSGPGVNGNQFNPSGLSGGISLTFTPYPGPCTDVATIVVNITTGAPPVLDVFPPVCGSASSIINLPPVQGGLSGTWSGPGVVGDQFDPSTVSGSVTLTFTPSGNCGGPASTNITILPEAIPQLENFDPICENGLPMFLSGSQGAYTGTWSGPGVAGNNFDPTGLIGSATITFTPDPGQCAAPADAIIILEQPAPIFIDPIGPVCEIEGLYFLNPVIDGVLGSWSGPGVNGNDFDPLGLNGPVELTFTPDIGECAEPSSTFVDITNSTLIVLDNINSPCGNQSSIPLPPVQDGVFGTWSGNGVFNNEFDPSGIDGGVTLTFTPDPTACAEPVSTVIAVIDPPPIDLEPVPPMCSGDGLVFLSPTQNGIFGTWSGFHVDGDTFDPTGVDGSVSLLFTPDPAYCFAPNSLSIDVSPAAQVNLESFPSLCESDALIALPPFQDGVSGTWTGQGVNGDQFDPIGISGGSELTFTPDPGQCAEPASTFIEVTPSSPLVLDTYGPFCDNDATFELPFSPSGLNGTWSGNGVNGTQFDPNGQFGVVEVTFTPTPGQCVEAASTFIEVTLGQEIILDFFDPICDGDAPVFLSPSQTGITGIWSGDGVSSGLFDPSGQEGSVELTFTPDPGQCTEPATTFIDISPGETVLLDSFEPICASDNPIDLPFTQNGVTGLWEGQGVDGNTFNPIGQSGNVELIFTPDPGQCAESASTMIAVDAASTPNLETFNPMCEEDGVVPLSSTQDGVEGSWIGTGVFNNAFDPFGQEGVIELTFIPNNDQCAVEASTFVEVGTVPSAILITNTNTCNTSAEGSVVDFASMIIEGDTNGDWSDIDNAGVDLGNSGSVDFENVEPGTYMFTYTVSSASGTCPDQYYDLEVLVENCACPSVATNSPEEICNADGILDLSSLQETSEEGTWSIVSTPSGSNSASLNGSIFDATNADAGTYEVLFTLDEEPFAGCPSSSEQIIIVNDAAPPTLNSFNDMCPTDAAINLPSIQDGITGTWSGDGINGTEFNPSGLDGTITLTFTPEDGQCSSVNTTTVDVMTASAPTLESFSDMCPTDAPISLQTTQDNVSGTWSGDGVSANQFNPSGQNGIVELTFTPEAGTCALVATTNINVVSGVQPNLTSLSPICEQDTPISLATTQDGYTGTWSGTNVNANQFNPSGQSGTIELTFTPTDGQCALVATTNIEVNSASTPNLDNFAALCQTDVAFDLPTSQDNFTGNWSGNGVSANQFVPDNQSGSITLTFTPDAGQCAVENTTTIEVGTPAFATLSSNSLNTCNTSADGSILDFAALIQSGDANGTWVDTDNTGVDLSDLSNVDFDGITSSSQTYTFTYTTNSATAPCVDQSYNIEVLVENCVCPSVATSAPESLCNINGTIDLSTLQVTGEAGVWTITSTPSGSTSDVLDGTMFNAAGAYAGTYEITFTIDNIQSDCPSTSTQTLVVDEAVIPTLTPLNDICSEAAPLALAGTQDGIAGQWSGTGVENNEFNPAGLNGDILLTFTPTNVACSQSNSTMITVSNEITPILDQFSGLCDDDEAIALPAIQSNITGTWSGDGVTNNQFTPIAGQYGDVELTFTPDAGQCAGTNITTINVADCSCPPIGISAPSPLCNENGTLDLTTLVDANSESGTWTITGTPSGNSPAILNGTSFEATGADEGSYEITYTLDNPQVDCPSSTSQTLVVNSAPNAGTGSTAVSCNDESALINLNSLLTGQDAGGIWALSANSGTPNSGTFDSNAGTLNPLDQAIGNFEFTYTVTGLEPCPEDVTTVMVTIEDCECPSVALGSIEAQCNDAALVDLNPIQLTSEPGTWAIISAPNGNNPATLDGTTFDGTNADPGIYTLEFTLDNPQLDCASSNTVTIEINELLSAGVANPPITICNTEDTNIALADEINDESNGGQWTETSDISSTNNAFNANNGSFNPVNQPAGVYTFSYMVGSINSACPPSETIVTIIVEAAPTADAGNDQLMDCSASVLLNGSASIGSSFEWTNENGDVVGTTPTITVTNHGTYTLTVRTGECEDSDDVTIIPPGVPMEILAGLTEPGCTGTTGSISLNVQGGMPPYQYSINGTEANSGQFNNLNPGTYQLNVTDELGCMSEIEVLVPEPIEVTLDLGPDHEINLGDEVDIFAETNISLDQLESMTWSQDSICADDCLEAFITPSETITVSATIMDENGCTATDNVQIFVDRRPDIYPPTAFSPDGDGYNDFFMIYTGKNVKKLNAFQVFNRWGELVFENYNVTLNKSDEGWNGSFKGKDMNPDVFVWWAEFELSDGTTKLMKGDISLVK